MAEHADLIQQLAGTDGYCHLWAAALGTLRPDARIVTLFPTDRRVLDRHDWPDDVPLPLHSFALLPDGTAVDAQGQHSLSDMLSKFGIGRGHAYRLEDVDAGQTTVEALEEFNAVHGEAAGQYLALVRHLGWGEDFPAYDGELERNFKAVRMQAREHGIPDPVVPMPTNAR